MPGRSPTMSDRSPALRWRYDGNVLRTVTRTGGDGPTQPGRLYVNLWASDGPGANPTTLHRRERRPS